MPMVLWSCLFMETQGYEVKDNIVYQDNKSTILLDKNGRASIRNKTMCTIIRYCLWQIGWQRRTSAWNIALQRTCTDIFVPVLQKIDYTRQNIRQLWIFNIMILMTTECGYTVHRDHISVLVTIIRIRIKLLLHRQVNSNTYVAMCRHLLLAIVDEFMTFRKNVNKLSDIRNISGVS